MPVVHELVRDYVPKAPTHFLDEEINQKAKKDFCYLATQSNLAHIDKLKHVVLSNSTNNHVCDVAVIGATEKDSMVKFPKSILITEEDAYVGLVLYDSKGNNVEAVYMFDLATVRKTGMFSAFKDLKDEDSIGINLKAKGKWGNYKFGYVLREYIK